MSHDPQQHHRRSIRLSGYDYAQEGAYFVTICTEDHVCLFGDAADDGIRLNSAGQRVQAAWDELTGHYPGTATDAFVVMPNHIHGVIVLTSSVGAGPCACPDDARQAPRTTEPQQVPHSREPGAAQGIGQPRGVAPASMSLADVVHRFKTWTTRRYIDGVRRSGWPPFPGRLWQRNYHEHIIRSDRALNHIRQYIVENPARWAQDRENPAAITPEEPDAWRI